MGMSSQSASCLVRRLDEPQT